MQVDFKRFYSQDKNIQTTDITKLIQRMKSAYFLRFNSDDL